MTGSFSFNGINSESFGLICKSVKRPLLPAVKVSSNDSKGTSGIHDRAETEYDSRQISMKIQFKEDSFEDLRIKARQIAAWLSSSTRKKLIINDEPDKYYLGKIVEDTDLNFIVERLSAGSADLVFVCQPYAYALSPNSYVFTSSDLPECSFVNDGTRVIDYKASKGSTSIIKVVGSWTQLTLSMNNYSIIHTKATTNQELQINNIELEGDLGGLNCVDDLDGDIDDFLPIIPGSNTLYVTGQDLVISSITIEFIKLWI